MQIATWNVNSLKVRLEQVIAWLKASNCDILALQELKLDNVSNEKLVAEFKQHGYYYIYNGQKTYNGVAIISRFLPQEVILDLPNSADVQKRVISATINDLRIICAYFVNGESLTSDKYQYKLAWLTQLQQYVKAQLELYPNLVLLGDFNIAPEDRDTYDPEFWRNQVLCSDAERGAFNALINLGLVDALRNFNQQDKQYTWWDYRNLAFRRKQGLRIDHILVTPPLIKIASACVIDTAPRKLERPSDHTPVILSLN